MQYTPHRLIEVQMFDLQVQQMAVDEYVADQLFMVNDELESPVNG